jgi:hypothetical protein
MEGFEKSRGSFSLQFKGTGISQSAVRKAGNHPIIWEEVLESYIQRSGKAGKLFNQKKENGRNRQEDQKWKERHGTNISTYSGF